MIQMVIWKMNLKVNRSLDLRGNLSFQIWKQKKNEKCKNKCKIDW
jgi:hypothetical protein